MHGTSFISPGIKMIYVNLKLCMQPVTESWLGISCPIFWTRYEIQRKGLIAHMYAYFMLNFEGDIKDKDMCITRVPQNLKGKDEH